MYGARRYWVESIGGSEVRYGWAVGDERRLWSGVVVETVGRLVIGASNEPL